MGMETLNPDTVGFYSALLWYPVGPSDLMHAFFSTIAVRLEDNSWGGRFPVLMNYLYDNGLRSVAVTTAIAELAQVVVGFSQFPVAAMVWDSEDRSLPVPRRFAVKPPTLSLDRGFVTMRGEPLVDLLQRALHRALEENQGLGIVRLRDLPTVESSSGSVTTDYIVEGGYSEW